jgi:hypothetical protein
MNNDNIYNLLTELQKTVLSKAVEPAGGDQGPTARWLPDLKANQYHCQASADAAQGEPRGRAMGRDQEELRNTSSTEHEYIVITPTRGGAPPFNQRFDVP